MLSGRTRTPRCLLIDDDGKTIAAAAIPRPQVLIGVSGGCGDYLASGDITVALIYGDNVYGDEAHPDDIGNLRERRGAATRR